MQQKCKYVKEMEQKMNKIIKSIIAIGIVIIIPAIIYIIYKCKFLICDTNGQVDMSIFWTAMGAVVGVFGFLGVIITIILSEKSRRKQNVYEFQEENMIKEQMDFKKEIKKMIDEVDPVYLMKIMGNLDDKNLFDIGSLLIEYNMKLNDIEAKVIWYYDFNDIVKLEKLDAFIKELRSFKVQMESVVEEYHNSIIEYGEEVIFNSKVPNFGVYGITEEDIKEHKKKMKDVRNKIKKVNQEIVDYLNQGKMQNLYEMAKAVCEERNELVAEKLEEMDR